MIKLIIDFIKLIGYTLISTVESSYHKSKKIIKLIKNLSIELTKKFKTTSEKLKKHFHFIKKQEIAKKGLDGKGKKGFISDKKIIPKIKNKKVTDFLIEYPFISKFKERLVRFIKYVLVFTFGVVFAVIFIFIPFELFNWIKELPSPEKLSVQRTSNSTKILDRKGRLLYEIYVDRRYEPVKLEKIPTNLINATISVEDSGFYDHRGIRPISMIRAAKETLFNGNVQGGSTITQQLIKNVLLTPEQTMQRKLKEIALALMVETKYSKSQILEMYLNNISYGGTAWGVQAASQKYFGKNVWELNLAESSMLAGLPSAPTTYSPLNNLEISKERQKYVLDRMRILGFITESEAEEAYTQEIKIAEQIEYIRAPHFVDYVRRDLESKYGRRFVEQGGLTIVTSLDLDLQAKVQEIVKDEVEKSQKYDISNGASVVLDTQSAEILAYVGSVDYFKENWGAFDVASAFRQPGSSIKPVTYSLALSQEKYTPATIIKDGPVEFRIKGSKPYKPVNYDGKYHGNVTLRSALANSYNIPAVRLANDLGPDNIVALGKQMGLSGWEVDGKYGLSITLGGREVRLLDLSNLYASFGRRGEYKIPKPYLSIKDANGYEILPQSNGEAYKVVSEGVAYLIWNILSDSQARLPAFGTRNFLTIDGHKIAVKTGTTDEKRDNWTLGFTPEYTVGVWVGNNDNKPMNKYLASGLSGAAPMWNRIMTAVLEGKNSTEPDIPDSIFIKKDELCGNKTEYFIKGSKVPAHLCVIKKDDGDDKDRDEEKKD